MRRTRWRHCAVDACESKQQIQRWTCAGFVLELAYQHTKQAFPNFTRLFYVGRLFLKLLQDVCVFFIFITLLFHLKIENVQTLVFLLHDEMLINDYVRDSCIVRWSKEAEVEKIEPEKQKRKKEASGAVGGVRWRSCNQSRRSARVGHEITALRAKRSETQLWNDKHDGVQQTHRRDAHMSSFKVKENSNSLSSGEFYLLAGSQSFFHP